MRRPAASVDSFSVPPFKLDSAFTPTADQPKAVVSLAEGILGRQSRAWVGRSQVRLT